MDTNKSMTRGEFLKLVSGFGFAAIVAKASAFIPGEAHKSAVTYGKNTYGGKAA
jgi:hypothetical protein